MRSRTTVLAVSFALAVALVAGFWAGATPTDGVLAGQETTTTAPASTEVRGKVLERSPTKDAIDLESMAVTGVVALSRKAAVGVALVGVGIVIVTVVSRAPPARPPRA